MLYSNARSAAGLADPLVDFFKLLTNDKLKRGEAISDADWFAAYDSPQRVAKVLLDTVGRDMGLEADCSLYEAFRRFVRHTRKYGGLSDELKKAIGRRFARRYMGRVSEGDRAAWLKRLLESGGEYASALIKDQQAEDRAMLDGTWADGPPTEWEREAWASVEWRWFMLVCLPCLVLYQRWPHHLLREIDGANLEPVWKLIQVDQRAQYHPAIAARLGKLLEDDPKAYRNQLSRNAKKHVQAQTPNKIKMSLIALLYELHAAMPLKHQKATVEEFFELFDLFTAAKSKARGSRDELLPGGTWARIKALEPRRKAWRQFIDDSLEVF